MTLAAEYPITLLCQALDLARSSYYYRVSGASDPALQGALLQLPPIQSGAGPLTGIVV
jgi:hypothetical protein